MTARFAHLLTLPLLTGCVAESGNIPSLAPRAAETRGFEEPATPPPKVASPDSQLDARIAGVTGAASGQAHAFQAARTNAEAKVAAASSAAPGSDAWLDAQVALGSLDTERAAASETVTALEQLAADRAVAGEPPYPALESALAAARAQADEAGATIAALNAKLKR